MPISWKEKVKLLVKEGGIRPSKAKGQSFLVDEHVTEQMVAIAGVNKNTSVLEIGPGLGIMTERLVKEAKKVLAVELDNKLYQLLEQVFYNQQNLTLRHEDILDVPLAEIVKCLGREYIIVANIPYAISSPLFKKFLTQEPKPKTMTVLVQKEVAERITAGVGGTSLLSLAVQTYGKPEMMELVPKEAFYPVPKVTSAILHVDLSKPGLKFKNKEEEKRFWQVARIGFSARRKQLHNNLVAGLMMTQERVKEVLEAVGIEEKARPQELTLEQQQSQSSNLETEKN
ncbi:MAG: 16S rRNA (adenine(1518)-N(6)/adenine(1519)-N(6))-dimethyltransferase RsmA [bacterium]